jgi:hypothetical protein
MHAELWSENQKVRDNLETYVLDGRAHNIKRYFKETGYQAWAEIIWIRVGTNGELL